MKPTPLQQALAGIAVLFVIAATLVGGVLLALSDNPDMAAQQATHTPFSTATQTWSPPPTKTATPGPSEPTDRPANTPVPSATNPPSTNTSQPPAASSCQIASGWVPYTVQAGETLYKIGLRYGVTVDTLQNGNCMSTTVLSVGDVIYVPPVAPVSPTNTPVLSVPQATITPGPSPTPSMSDGICTNPSSTITSPGVYEVLSGVVQIRGSATHADFSFYKLEVRQEGYSTSADFATFFMNETPVVNGVLGEIDTSKFSNGEYWLRLVVVDNTSNYPERCSILVVFQN
ncbi:MAG: LysM peptidoglycan-binding domain-containing protein [Anaerolineae bacterium]|nr:LysM peptidoglycan-binding domain-containing protein [Anaerolineae bacterium]